MTRRGNLRYTSGCHNKWGKNKSSTGTRKAVSLEYLSLKATHVYSSLLTVLTPIAILSSDASDTILPTANNQSAFWSRTTSDSDSAVPQERQTNTLPPSSTAARQFAMQSTITKQEMQEMEELASLSTIFDMPTPKLEVPHYETVSGASNMAHHSRSISADSASSSLAGQDYPTPYHESLGYNFRRINPEGYVLQRSPAPLARRQHAMTPYQTVPPLSNSRHRGHPVTSDDDEEVEEQEIQPLPENATAAERKEYKKIQNTLAARRSRKRKAELLRRLENEIDRLNREKDIWRERANMMVAILSENGLPCPKFDQHTNIL